MKKTLVAVVLGSMMILAGCEVSSTHESVTEASFSIAEDISEEVAAEVAEETAEDYDASEEAEAVQATLTYMGGLYVNGNPDTDMEMAMFRNTDGDLIYLMYENGTLLYGMPETESATLDDGRTVEKVLLENTEFSYYFNEDLTSGILVDEEGNVYDALALDEGVARDLVTATITGEL